MIYDESDFEILGGCPWCSSNNHKKLYDDTMGCDIVRCCCGIVYAKKRLNGRGRRKFWSDYMSRIHEADEKLNQKRRQMYIIERDFLLEFIPNGNVLDIGCGKGDFMELFRTEGFQVTGVEYGEEAYAAAVKLGRNVLLGEFPNMELNLKYDLIIFRGTIQYFPNPKDYFKKAISLLRENGFIYIYYVNTSSICFDLFGANFTQPVSAADNIGYSDSVLSNYFRNEGFVKVSDQDYYLGTPYEDYKNDIRKVAQAIDKLEKNEKINEKCPPFFGNIKGILFQKRS